VPLTCRSDVSTRSVSATAVDDRHHLSDAAAALGTADFAPLMAPFVPFERHPELAVAVSGGRDSLALALLSHDWATVRGGRIVALIVDHGLRPESAAEARATRDRLAALGIAAEILLWLGSKPRSGLQETARRARYELLLQACRRHGILHLLTAHHADDQGETIRMRAARDSGPDGLAGIAALVERREARLLRPLLEVPRARLTATLQARNVAWIDDPSNDDLRFERARLRRRSAESRSGEAAADAGARRGARAERDAVLASACVAALEVDDEAGVMLDRSAFEQLADDVGARLLSRVVQAVAAKDYPPRRERLVRAARRLGQEPIRGKSGKGLDFTLSGCRLMLRQARQRLRWIVQPENGRKNSGKAGQPLIPAAFFTCGAPPASHLH
jgi:tRNA(Ile)-lysidine synthase